MIPKKIHYCWFGRNPLPETARKCIESWRKFLPDYEIIEWNEDNFDVNSIPYTAEAYAAKKYAFVSDYARFKVLYEHGGLYFDTDVEVIKPMDDILAKGPFMGAELGICHAKKYRQSDQIVVNPGLGLGASAGMSLYSEVISHYSDAHFNATEGNEVMTVCEHTTRILNKHGLKNQGEVQQIKGINIYPADWFNPLDSATGRLLLTDNTHSIHWYAKSWYDKESKFRTLLSRFAHRFLGVSATQTIVRVLKLK